MPDTLKKETVSALIWNATDKIGFQVVALAVGIFTARMLSPKDFGLIGALAIFTMLSNLLVESGFTSALVRRNHNTDAEYTAILYFNLALSLSIYLILFISAPLIAQFFHMPELCDLSRFLFLAIIINSFGIVQNIVLTKQLSFRLTSVADLLSALVAGIITVAMVLKGYEYWALAWQIVLQVAVRVLILWIFSSWRFSLKPDFRIIKEVFSFSIFLLVTSIINTIVKNVYNILIGRYFSVQQLGYYAQANKFQQIPSNVISSTMSGVAFPVLSKLNPEPHRQITYFRKIMRITAFMVFPAMIGLLSLTSELVSIVLTDKWQPAVPYFQLMIIAAIVLPFHTLNLNIIVVKGSSRLNFALEMLKNALIILTLFFCISSIEMMLVGFSIASLLSYISDLFFVKSRTGYKIIDQLKDIAPYALISGLMFLIVKAIALLNLGLYTKTALQILAASLFYFLTLKILGSKVIDDAINLFRHKK